jgi:hypothetical protein
VLVTTSHKWVYMLISVEKWLCESQKKKTVVDGAMHLHLIRHFEVLKKNILLRYFFYRTIYFNPKFQLICNQIDLAMEYLCWAAILIYSAILFFFAPIYFF